MIIKKVKKERNHYDSSKKAVQLQSQGFKCDGKKQNYGKNCSWPHTITAMKEMERWLGYL